MTMLKEDTHRVLTVLEKRLYDHVTYLAKRDGISISQKVRDLLIDALKYDEDADLVVLVKERRKKSGKFISHEDLWQRQGVK